MSIDVETPKCISRCCTLDGQRCDTAVQDLQTRSGRGAYEDDETASQDKRRDGRVSNVIINASRLATDFLGKRRARAFRNAEAAAWASSPRFRVIYSQVEDTSVYTCKEARKTQLWRSGLMLIRVCVCCDMSIGSVKICRTPTSCV